MHPLKLVAWTVVAAAICFHGYRFAHLPDPFSPDFDEEAIAVSKANFEKYQRTVFATIGPRAQLERMLHRALDRSSSFDDLEPAVRALFVDFYLDVLDYCRSRNYGEYQSRWIGRLEPTVDPATQANLRYFYRRWLALPYPTQASPATLAREMTEFEGSFENGSTQIVACSFDPGGFLARKIIVDSLAQPRDAWLQELSDQQQKYWLGSVVKSSNILQRPPASLDSLLRRGEAVIWIDTFTIAMTRDADMFPLRVRCWYHPANGGFVLAAVDQQSSIIAAQKPPLTF